MNNNNNQIIVIQDDQDIMPLSVYCLRYGEKRDTINKRVQRGIWAMGKHVIKIPNVRERWIDVKEVKRWARESSRGAYR